MFDWILEPFRYEFMLRGLGSALLLSISGGLLGCILILRRMALMGDALAHSLLPGIAFAYLLFGPSLPALFVGALAAGMLTAGGSAVLSRLTRIKEDAAFGSLFIIFFGAGITLITIQETRINLVHFLFGNILGVSPADLAFSAAGAVATVTAFALFHRGLILETFDPIFNRAVGGRGGWIHLGFVGLTVFNLVASLQAMGVVLSLGLFLLPAVTAYLWSDRITMMFGLSVSVAMTGSIVGLLLSFHFGLPSGGAIVLCLGAIFFASALVCPRHGLISRLRTALRAGKGVLHTPD